MSSNTIERRLQVSGILLILGLVVEGLTLLGHGPIAFILFVCLGGTLFAAGIFLFLYALVATKAELPKPKGHLVVSKDGDG